MSFIQMMALTPTLSGVRGKTLAKAKAKTCVRACSRSRLVTKACSDVNSDLLSMITLYLCNKTPSCLDYVHIPDWPAQVRTVINMRNIQENVDLNGYDGLVLKELLDGQQETVKAILDALSTLHDVKKELEQYKQDAGLS